MDEIELRNEARARGRKFKGALAAVAVGGAMTAVGFFVGLQRSGDAATGWGVLAGVGLGVMFGGAILAILMRPGETSWRTEAVQSKRDRLQSERARQLWLLPLVGVAFLLQSVHAVQEIVAGEGGLASWLRALVPVLYAWVVAAIAMGWDYQSRKNRRFMEDELTAALRARAIGAAFVVLMLGATGALVIGLWRAESGVVALPFVLTAAGATAGIRFAWLDREYGKDG